ncbi:MAG TPA: PQQ-binding-like beta-propeller repeat protein [Terriglobia bacterium]|nr:PQQ-binding-like beta-propeller repeat protein [Terriglobia bacterium]
MRYVIAVTFALSTLVPALFAAPVSGEAVYQQRCAACHDSGNSRVPPRDELKKLSVSRILRTLDFGEMNNIATKLNKQEREAVAAYLGVPGGNGLPAAKAYCADRTVKLTGRSKTEWNGWSPALTNTRYQPNDAAGLTLGQVSSLKLKWAYGFDGDIIAFSQPTVLDGHLFVGSASGLVQALSTESGCVKWIFQATGPVRSALLAVPIGDKHALLFGDSTGWFYAVEAETGRLLWKKRPEPHEATRLTGAALAYQGMVFIPVASWEESRTSNPEYPCCTFRGSVVALRIKDGSQAWKTYAIAEKAKQTGPNQWGPSGAGIWSTPTLDTKRSLLYVTTGDNYSAPATPMSDAVLALELATGRVAWSRQTTPGDVWNSLCSAKGDCPGPDYDYGSSVILEKLDNGRDVLLAGQKSGMVYALDPDRKGEILWQVRVGQGGTNGGVQWGMASDGQQVYAATSDVTRSLEPNADALDPRPQPVDPKTGGGLTALRIATGEKVWFSPPIVCAPGAKRGCSPAQSQAVTAIPGLVFSGSLDGHLRAYSAEEGKVLWDFDTVRDYQTVNGVRATGGSLNGPGAVVAGGMLFVNSGYARLGSIPGNVLLAFSIE